MSLGTEIVLILVLGLLLLGPKRLQTILGLVARAKAQFEKAIRSISSQLEVDLEAGCRKPKTEASQDRVENQ